jgi:hypothetical protein
MRKYFASIWTFLLLVLLVAPANAAIDLPEAIAVTDVETMAGVILTALGTIWCIRKIIKMTNKS